MQMYNSTALTSFSGFPIIAGGRQSNFDSNLNQLNLFPKYVSLNKYGCLKNIIIPEEKNKSILQFKAEDCLE